MRLNQVFMLIVASAGIVGMGVASCQPQRAFDTEATSPAQTSPAQTSPPASQPQAVDRDVPYVPTPESVVAEMLRVANTKSIGQ